jgi:outer membrane receptor protein involved in Fe transport
MNLCLRILKNTSLLKGTWSITPSQALVVLAVCTFVTTVPLSLLAQTKDGTASSTPQKKKPTRAEILKMKIEDLIELPLEEVLELQEIMGVSSLEELINLIVTTASKSAEKLQDAAGIVTVITPKEIEAFGAISLLEVLDRVVSLYFVGNATFAQNMLSIRGSAQEAFNTQVLFLIDGRPFRESVHGGFTSPIIPFPLSTIERIEIVRGPGSVLYGTAAYTGVINIITKKTDLEFLKVSTRYGSFNTLQGELGGGFKVGDLSITGGVNYYDTGGWDFTARGEGDNNRAAKTIQMFSRNIGAMLKAEYKKFTLSAYYGSVYQASMNATPTWGITTATSAAPRPTMAQLTNPAISTPALTLERANLINRLIVDAGYTHEFSSIWSASLNVTYNSLLFRFFRTDDAYKDDDVRRLSNDVLVELTNYIRPTDNVNIIIGGLTNTQTGQAFQPTFSPVAGRTALEAVVPFNLLTGTNPNPLQTIAPYNQTWFTGYFQADWKPVDWLKVIAGGQLNKVTDVPLDFVPRLGLLLNPIDELRFKVLYGQAFRSATAFERQTISMPNIIGGNVSIPGRAATSLDPEKITTFEVQTSYTGTAFDVSLTYFRSEQINLIRRTVSGDMLSPRLPWEGTTRSVPIYVNLDRLTSYGLEFEGKAQIGENFTVFASATYQKNTDGTNEDIFGMPIVMAKLGLLYKNSFVNVGVFNSYFGVGGDIRAANNLNPEPAGYNYLSANVTLDLKKTFGWGFTDGLALNVYGTNLLDAAIYYPEYVRRVINSIPGRPGRAIYGGIEVKF